MILIRRGVNAASQMIFFFFLSLLPAQIRTCTTLAKVLEGKYPLRVAKLIIQNLKSLTILLRKTLTTIELSITEERKSGAEIQPLPRSCRLSIVNFGRKFVKYIFCFVFIMLLAHQRVQDATKERYEMEAREGR